MATHRDISPVIAFVTPGILELLADKRGINLEEAARILYGSRLYEALEDEFTKAWRLSYHVLYDLLEEELATGQIIWPEEQG